MSALANQNSQVMTPNGWRLGNGGGRVFVPYCPQAKHNDKFMQVDIAAQGEAAQTTALVPSRGQQQRPLYRRRPDKGGDTEAEKASAKLPHHSTRSACIHPYHIAFHTRTHRD